jgi:hypothetical protein
VRRGEIKHHHLPESRVDVAKGVLAPFHGGSNRDVLRNGFPSTITIHPIGYTMPTLYRPCNLLVQDSDDVRLQILALVGLSFFITSPSHHLFVCSAPLRFAPIQRRAPRSI